MSFDFSELREFQNKLKNLENGENDFVRSCTTELAARLLGKVVPRTPVGEYNSNVDGKLGGTLRRGWTAINNSMVNRIGNIYKIDVINTVKYASYVEYGHRQTPGRFVPALGKRLKSSWVPGQFFLTHSEIELEKTAPAILEKKLDNYLRGALE